MERRAEETVQLATSHYDRFEFSRALEAIWSLVGDLDKYLVEAAPWVVAKDSSSREKLQDILYASYHGLRVATYLIYPVMPQAAQRIWKQLGLEGRLSELKFDDLHWGPPSRAIRVGKPEAVFPRVEKSETIERIEVMEKEASQPIPTPSAGAGATAGAAPAAQPNGKIAIEDFLKVEMRVGQVHTAERVQGADKLLKVNVDIGGEVRQIVAGIAQHYKAEDLIGRKVIVVVNLQPRKLRGVESNGMIVAASVGPEGRPVLAGFLEEVEVGARLK